MQRFIPPTEHMQIVHLLPPETLLSIFSFGADATLDDPETISSAFIFPIAVSHVCQRWRTIALTCPSLWRWIVVCEPSNRPFLSTKSPSCMERIRTFVARSSSCQLFLHLDLRDPSWVDDDSESGSDEDESITDAEVRGLAEVLVPHIHRWSSLDILCDVRGPIIAFLAHCYGEAGLHSAPGLRRLAIQLCDGFLALDIGGQEGDFSRADFARDFLPLITAPKLQDLAIAGLRLDWKRNVFANLTLLSIVYVPREHCPSTDELSGMLASCPDLQALNLRGWIIRSCFIARPSTSNGNLQCKSIVLPKLKNLSLGWIDVEHCSYLLSAFSWDLPRLESLALEDGANRLEGIRVQESSDIFDTICRTVMAGTRTRWSVKSLSLLYIHCRENSIVQLLKLIPSMDTIQLDNTDDVLAGIFEAALGAGELDSSLNFVGNSREVKVTTNSAEDVSDARHLLENSREYGRNQTIVNGCQEEVHSILGTGTHVRAKLQVEGKGKKYVAISRS